MPMVFLCLKGKSCFGWAKKNSFDKISNKFSSMCLEYANFKKQSRRIRSNFQCKTKILIQVNLTEFGPIDRTATRRCFFKQIDSNQTIMVAFSSYLYYFMQLLPTTYFDDFVPIDRFCSVKG